MHRQRDDLARHLLSHRHMHVAVAHLQEMLLPVRRHRVKDARPYPGGSQLLHGFVAIHPGHAHGVLVPHMSGRIVAVKGA